MIEKKQLDKQERKKHKFVLKLIVAIANDEGYFMNKQLSEYISQTQIDKINSYVDLDLSSDKISTLIINDLYLLEPYQIKELEQFISYLIWLKNKGVSRENALERYVVKKNEALANQQIIKSNPVVEPKPVQPSEDDSKDYTIKIDKEKQQQSLNDFEQRRRVQARLDVLTNWNKTAPIRPLSTPTPNTLSVEQDSLNLETLANTKVLEKNEEVDAINFQEIDLMLNDELFSQEPTIVEHTISFDEKQELFNEEFKEIITNNFVDQEIDETIIFSDGFDTIDEFDNFTQTIIEDPTNIPTMYEFDDDVKTILNELNITDLVNLQATIDEASIDESFNQKATEVTDVTSNETIVYDQVGVDQISMGDIVKYKDQIYEVFGSKNDSVTSQVWLVLIDQDLNQIKIEIEKVQKV